MPSGLYSGGGHIGSESSREGHLDTGSLFHLPYGIVGEYDGGTFHLLSPGWTESAASPAAFADRYSLPLLAVSRKYEPGWVSYSILERLDNRRNCERPSGGPK